MGVDLRRYDEDIENYGAGVFRAQLDGTYDRKGSLLRFSYDALYQVFEDRPIRNVAGAAFDGELEWITHTYELMNRHRFFEDERLEMETRFGFGFRDDNGGGWYDLGRLYVRETLRMRVDPVQAEFRFGVATSQYDIREAPGGPDLERDILTLGTRLAWLNRSRVQPFVDLGLTSQQSNNADQEYLQAAVTLGATIGF